MVFVELYPTELSDMLASNNTNCDAALTGLLRFTAEKKSTFRTKYAQFIKETQKGPSKTNSTIRQLMDFTKNCPAQVVQFNQALHALVRE